MVQIHLKDRPSHSPFERPVWRCRPAQFPLVNVALNEIAAVVANLSRTEKLRHDAGHKADMLITAIIVANPARPFWVVPELNCEVVLVVFRWPVETCRALERRARFT